MAKTIPADEQVFMVSKSTNTTYSGSAALKAMNEWYTMADVANTVQPYKVFTALLTQGGGDNPQERNNGDPLFKGITYYIDVNEGYDFTPYGAPNNNVGTYFVCNQDVLDTGDIFFSLQYNTGAPVATVLENTIGNVWFTYQALGEYRINSDNLFTIDKTYFQIVVMSNAPSFLLNNLNLDFIELLPTDGDDSLNNTPIEIRVYN